MAGSLSLLTGCVHAGESSSSVLSATNTSPQMTSPELTNQPGSNEDQLTAALGENARKDYEDNLHGTPRPSQFSFPNYHAGPGRPVPPYMNRYSVNDHYPDYLQCEYDVDAKNYSQSDEPGWFKTSLEKVRRLGPKKFPPIKWIAVIIVNRAEWQGASTFEQAHKVGAIFKASDVFDSSRSLSQLIASATMDRHPFFLDLKKPDLFPAEQQRWMIVERHAATNQQSAGPK